MLISKASVRFCKYTCGRLAQVFYKATELMNDQILMTGFAPGGLSQVPQSFFRTASLSAPLAQEQGIFGIKPEVAPAPFLLAFCTSARLGCLVFVYSLCRKLRAAQAAALQFSSFVKQYSACFAARATI